MARAAEAAARSTPRRRSRSGRGSCASSRTCPRRSTSLRGLYTRTEKWNALLELLKDDLDAVPAGDVDEKINRYLEIVAIYRDRLNLDVMVVNTYLNILALKPDHPAALAALASRYEAQGRYGDLVQILTRQADAATDPAERVGAAPAHRRAVGRQARQARQRDRQLREDLRVRSDRQRDQRAPQGPLHQGPRLAAADRGLPQGAAPPGRGGAPGAPDRDGAPRGRSPERRARVDRALQPGAGEGGDRDPDALAGLATLYERERRWPALIEILERQRLNAHAAERRAAELALLERRGTLLYERLGATQAAIEVFQRIQELQPKNARAARALREIYAQAGDYTALESLYAEHGAFGDLCDQLTSLADRTADMAARTRLLERVALIAQEKLNQPERALKAYERILATDPRNRGAALALLPLYRNGAEVAAPARHLRGAAGRRPAAGDGTTLADRLELLRRGAPDLRAAAGIEVAGVPVVRARVRGGAQERSRAHAIWSGWPARPTSGARWPRCTRRARRRRPTPRSGCGCCGGRCASPSRGFYRPQEARKARRADHRRARLRRGGRRRAGADPHPDQVVGRSGRSCCTGAPIAPRTPPSASACCSGSRSSRKSAWSTRPRRSPPGRRSSRRSRPTSARCAR